MEAAAGQNILPGAMILKDLPNSDDCFSLYPIVITIYPVISIYPYHQLYLCFKSRVILIDILCTLCVHSLYLYTYFNTYRFQLCSHIIYNIYKIVKFVLFTGF